MSKFPLIVIAGFLWGCSHTLVLTPQSTTEEYSQANQRVAGRTMNVVPRAGDVVKGVSFRLSQDTVAFFQTNVQQRVFLPMRDVRCVYARDSKKGAAEGFVTGVVVGTVGAFATIYTLTRHRAGDDSGGWGHFGATLAGLIYGGLWITFTPLAGMGIGAAIGDRTTVEFQPENAETLKH